MVDKAERKRENRSCDNLKKLKVGGKEKGEGEGKEKGEGEKEKGEGREGEKGGKEKGGEGEKGGEKGEKGKEKIGEKAGEKVGEKEVMRKGKDDSEVSPRKKLNRRHKGKKVFSSYIDGPLGFSGSNTIGFSGTNTIGFSGTNTIGFSGTSTIGPSSLSIKDPERSTSPRNRKVLRAKSVVDSNLRSFAHPDVDSEVFFILFFFLFFVFCEIVFSCVLNRL